LVFRVVKTHQNLFLYKLKKNLNNFTSLKKNTKIIFTLIIKLLLH